jgi:mannose/cellobiose epimerase-like protein (N-acyl-D-glucosamine 2-epimerase family)
VGKTVLVDRLRHEAEWADVLRDLDRLNETEVTASDGKRYVVRSETRGWCGKAYQAAGVALPPTLRILTAEEEVA